MLAIPLAIPLATRLVIPPATRLAMMLVLVIPPAIALVFRAAQGVSDEGFRQKLLPSHG